MKIGAQRYTHKLTGEKYFGTMNTFNAGQSQSFGVFHTDLCVLGVGKERLCLVTTDLIAHQGYETFESCPPGTLNCDDDTGTVHA